MGSGQYEPLIRNHSGGFLGRIVPNNNIYRYLRCGKAITLMSKELNKIDRHEQLSKTYLTRSKSPLRQAVKTSSP